MGRIGQTGALLREVVLFARAHRAWWMIPLFLVLGVASFLIVASQAAAPFVYTLF